MKATCVQSVPCEDESGKFHIEFWTGEVVKVTLLSWTNNPIEIMSRGMRGYIGNYSSDPLLPEEEQRFFEDLSKTKLANPLEWVTFTFLVNDVPRTWTHQAVRYRVGSSFVQESTRFFQLQPLYKLFVPRSLCRRNSDGELEVLDVVLFKGIGDILDYRKLLSNPHVIAEDARLILPHNILTHLYWNISLKALMNVFEKRWCCQAEPTTWLPFLKQVRREIASKVDVRLLELLSSPFMRREDCGFHASIDRPCRWHQWSPKELDQKLLEGEDV